MKTLKFEWDGLTIKIEMSVGYAIPDAVILAGAMLKEAKELGRGDPKVTEKGRVKLG